MSEHVSETPVGFSPDVEALLVANEQQHADLRQKHAEEQAAREAAHAEAEIARHQARNAELQAAWLGKLTSGEAESHSQLRREEKTLRSFQDYLEHRPASPDHAASRKHVGPHEDSIAYNSDLRGKHPVELVRALKDAAEHGDKTLAKDVMEEVKRQAGIRPVDAHEFVAYFKGRYKTFRTQAQESVIPSEESSEVTSQEEDVVTRSAAEVAPVEVHVPDDIDEIKQRAQAAREAEKRQRVADTADDETVITEADEEVDTKENPILPVDPQAEEQNKKRRKRGVLKAAVAGLAGLVSKKDKKEKQRSPNNEEAEEAGEPEQTASIDPVAAPNTEDREISSRTVWFENGKFTTLRPIGATKQMTLKEINDALAAKGKESAYKLPVSKKEAKLIKKQEQKSSSNSQKQSQTTSPIRTTSVNGQTGHQTISLLETPEEDEIRRQLP